MAILPVSTGRTSTPLATQRLLQQLGSDQIGLQRNFDQLSTGRRVLSLADDPAAAGRAISLTRDIAESDQQIRNANATETYYNVTDTALESVNTALINARATAVEAAQTIVSPAERLAFEASIQESINSVFNAGNTSFRDHQVLGGILGDGNPYRFDGGEIVYSGDAAIGSTNIGGGSRSSINLNGNAALGSGAVILEGEPIGASVDRSTRLVDLRGGRGVDSGVIRVSAGTNFQNVDLTNAFTIGDVVDILSDVEIDGRQLTASVLDDGIRIEYTDGLAGTLAIDDQVGGQTAAQLSILNPSGLTAPPIIGDGLTPRITTNTQIDDLAGGAGVDLTGGIRIEQGSEIFEVNFDDAQTIGEVIIAINRSGADVRASLNESEGRIVINSLRFGVDYSIGENGGDAATNLGIRSADEQTRIEDLGRGRGFRLNAGSEDLVITRPDGRELSLNLDDVETINDVINAIRNHPQNQDTSRVLVGLNEIGNGVQLRAPPGAQPLSIRQVGLSDAGIQLGLIPPGQSEVTGGVVGAVDTIVGSDYVPRDAGGALDTLLRLQSAVGTGDIAEIERLQAVLDQDLSRASEARGRVGVWTRNLVELRETAEDRRVSLEASRSEELDADLASVISEISQRQLALEASRRLIGQTATLTVLNFL